MRLSTFHDVPHNSARIIEIVVSKSNTISPDYHRELCATCGPTEFHCRGSSNRQCDQATRSRAILINGRHLSSSLPADVRLRELEMNHAPYILMWRFCRRANPSLLVRELGPPGGGAYQLRSADAPANVLQVGPILSCHDRLGFMPQLPAKLLAASCMTWYTQGLLKYCTICGNVVR